MRRRPYEIKLRLSEDEAQLLNTSVQKSGLSRESYLRALIKDKPIRERPPIDLINVLRSLQQISNNMNQLALKAHSLNFIDTAAYWKNVDTLTETIHQLLEVMYGS